MTSSASFIGTDTFRSIFHEPLSTSSSEASPLKLYSSHADTFIQNILDLNGPVKRGGETATYMALVTPSFDTSSKSYLSLSTHNKGISFSSSFGPGLLPGARVGPGTLKALEDFEEPIPVGREEWAQKDPLITRFDPAFGQQKSIEIVSPLSPATGTSSSPTLDREIVLPLLKTRPQSCTMETWSKPSETIHRLTIAFKTHDADVRYHEHKYSFDGIVYPLGVPLFFVTSLYSGDRGTTLIEFKRQEGSTLAFNQFYRSIREQLKPSLHQWCYGSEPRPVPSVTGASSPASLTHFQPVYRRTIEQMTSGTEGELNDGTLDILFEMVFSDDQLVRKRGVQALANYASTKDHAVALWHYSDRRYNKEGGDYTPMVKVFQRFFSQTEMDGIVLRSISALLKFCVMHPENMECGSSQSTCLGCQAIKCNLCDIIFALLEAPITVAMADVQRQLACALANLTLKHAACIRKSQNSAVYISTLQRICGDSGRCSVVVKQLSLVLDHCDGSKRTS